VNRSALVEQGRGVTGELSVIGGAEYRIEGVDKVTGAAHYTADLRREGMLEVAYVRSPYPHARIVSVDTSVAAGMPGVHAVLTGADVRPLHLGRTLQDWPLLAWDRVRLVGDRVAAVAAETRRQADAAADAVVVEYEELPAVFDPSAALEPDAPVMHPDHDSYRYLRGQRRPRRHPNMQGEGVHEHGDVEAGFSSAARSFEHTFDVARTYQGHLEPHVSMVWMDGDRFHVWSTNKAPFRLREQLAISLGIDRDAIVVDAGFIGGDFGGKGFSIDEYVLIVLARETGRPVRFVMPYADDMAAGNCRHRATATVRTGVDANGRIVAHLASFLYDGGAYAAAKGNADLMPGGGVTSLAGYHVPAARVEATCVYTNSIPGGHARAPGQPQASFVSESHVDLIARELGIDPLEFRRRNAVRDGGIDGRGREWGESSMLEVLDVLRRESGWDRPLPPGHGRGVAMGERPSPAGHGAGALSGSVVVSVLPDATVEVVTGVSDQGAGAYTMMQRVVAERLGLPSARVRVRRGNTDEGPYDLGAGGSRVTPVIGGAALAGAQSLAVRLDAIAPGVTVEEQLARAAELGGLKVDGEFQHEGGLHSTYAYAVEVDVDRDTGRVRVVDATFVADVGTVINPVAVRGQLYGGFAAGLGQALMEELVVEDGVVTSGNLGEYRMPTSADVPPLRVVLLSNRGGGPFGAKSAGELANVSIAPAIANAIDDAVGVRITSLPITAEAVYAGLRSADRVAFPSA
jgi:CO/xanthine dehydrogenase Mo-binding subunit